MDLRQIALWTALPVTFEPRGGNANPIHGLSMFASFRLVDAESLTAPVSVDNFRDVKNLPALLSQGLKFDVTLFKEDLSVAKKFEGLTPETPAAPTTMTGAPFQPLVIWSSLLSATTKADPYLKASAAERSILSLPFTTLAGRLHEQFSREMFDLASPAASGQAKADEKRRSLQLGAEEEKDLFAEAEARLNKYGFLDLDKPEWARPASDCYDQEQWEWGILRYVLKKQAEEIGRPKINAEQKNVEFQELLTAISQYPALARHLGLIYDLELPADSTLDALKSATHISVRPVWPYKAEAVVREDLSPRTRYVIDENDNRFELAQGNAPYKGGFLDLSATYKNAENKSAPLFNVQQLDPTLAAARPVDEKKTRVHALNTVGVALVWNGLGKTVGERLEKTTARQMIFNKVLQTPRDSVTRQDGSELEFNADDLVRGYCVDVLETSRTDARWRSLCERVGTYEFQDGLRKATFTDEGWVTTSGQITQIKNDSPSGNKEGYIVNDALFWWQGWSLVAPRPGSVVRQDGSIGSVEQRRGMGRFLSPTFTPVKQSLPRLRFAHSYQFRVRLVDLAGNRLTLSQAKRIQGAPTSETFSYGRYEPVPAPLVVQTHDLNDSPGETVSRLVIRTADSPEQNTNASERWILPPQASPFLAEAHGMFDKPPVWESKAWFIISARENSPPTTLPSRPDRLYYLPDPLACNAVVRGFPYGFQKVGTNVVRDVLSFPWNGGAGEWYEAKPWLLRLEKIRSGESRPASWDESLRELTVYLQPGTQACLQIANDISCYPTDVFVLPRPQPLSLSANKDSEKLQGLCAAIAQGCGTPLTPCASVEIVHAVQHPAPPPAFTSNNGSSPLQVYREASTNHAEFTGAVAVPVPSTGTIEVEAVWDERADSVPDVLKGSQGDRFIWYESYRKSERVLNAPLSGTSSIVSLTREPVPKSEDADEAKLIDVVQLRHVFSDTRHRVIQYTPIVTSRFTDCFLPEDSLQFDTRAPAPYVVSVPSSARPKDLHIRYAVPAFSHDVESKSTTVQRRLRRAQCIRIYLERPWYDSGDGEIVGVVLKGAQMADVPKVISEYMSDWGRDPLHWDANRIGALTPESFSNRIAALGIPELILSEQEAAYSEGTLPEIKPVRIVPHGVKPDTDRNCWYTDVILENVTTYTPFVRLALVRYQPNSLPGLYVSKVALTDFMQLQPNRAATVTQAGQTITVTVSGPGLTSEPTKVGNDDARVIEVGFESAPKPASGEPDEMAWNLHPVSSPIPPVTPSMFRLSYNAAIESWQGTVSVPPDMPAEPTLARRLVIREYERYLTDPGYGKGVRLVYAETFPVR